MILQQKKHISITLSRIAINTCVLSIEDMLRHHGINPLRPYTRIDKPDMDSVTFIQPPLKETYAA